jgi:hypothetical protein
MIEPTLEQETRVLLAWMSEPQARAALSAAAPHGVLAAEQEAFAASARNRLQARPAGVDQGDLILPLPGGMHDYSARLKEDPGAGQCFGEGFTPALVDLSRVCVFQPSVHIGNVSERAKSVRIDDVRSLAEFTLPLDAPPEITLQFDHDRLTFTTDPANQNLHVVGAFSYSSGDGPPGTVNVGFQLRVITSYVQVASVQGRYFLRDGYHRCLGLIQRGVRYAPALVRDDLPLADLVPPGMLDFPMFMGDRPPVLPDYWDSSVSCSVQVPVSRNVVVIRASELSVAG